MSDLHSLFYWWRRYVRNTDQNFKLDCHRLKSTLIENLMTQVKTRIVVSNLYYIVGGVKRKFLGGVCWSCKQFVLAVCCLSTGVL